MQPGRVGLSAQLIISLMRHRECVMKAKRVFLIAIGVFAIVAGVSSGQFAEADAVENEAVSIMGSVFDDTICPICGESYGLGSCTRELRDADSCLYYCYCFSSTSHGGHGYAGYYKVHSEVDVEESEAGEGYCPDIQMTCLVCGDTAVESTHELITTSTATCLESGVRTEKCAKCAYTYSEKEAPFGHSYTCIFERLPEESVPGEQIYQCERCGWMYGKTTMASLTQHDEIPKWIPIVMIAEGAVILFGVVTGIVLVCVKKRGANKCNGGKSS